MVGLIHILVCTHTMVVISLEKTPNISFVLQANILPHPWDDCAEKPLKYFDDYTRATCNRECEIEELIRTCGCMDAYMPYTHAGVCVC